MPRLGYNQTPEHRERIAIANRRPRKATSVCDYPLCSEPTRPKLYSECPKHRVLGKKLREVGLTFEEYCKQASDQEWICAICGKKCTDPCGNIEDRSSVFQVDHDPITGRFRGLLCTNCNVGLGQFKDSIFSLESAIVYLQGALLALT